MEEKKGKAGEQLKDKELSDCSSLLQSQSGPSRPRPWSGLYAPTDVWTGDFSNSYSSFKAYPLALREADKAHSLAVCEADKAHPLAVREADKAHPLALREADKAHPLALREADKAHKPSFLKPWPKPALKKEHSAIISTTDSSDYPLDQPPPGKLIEAGMRKKQSSAAGGTPGVNQDDTRDMELHAAAAGPSSFQLSTSSPEEDVYLDPSNFGDERFVSLPNQLNPLSGWSGFTDISVHQRRWPPKPPPRKLSTIDAEKGALDGQSVTYGAGEQLKHKDLSNFLVDLSVPESLDMDLDGIDYLPETPSKQNQLERLSRSSGFTDISVHQKRWQEVNQDDTRDMELHAAAGPSSFQLSTSSPEEDVYLDPSNFDDERFVSLPSATRAGAGQFSTVCSGGSRTQDVYELSEQSEPGGDGDAPPDMDVPVTAVNCSVTNTLPARSHLQIFSSDPRWSRRDSSGLPRSHSMPSLSQITSPKTCRGAGSLPNMLLETSFEEFTPDITDDEHDETYRFQSSGPGLYQCSVTGLVFHMEGEGVLVYRTVPWSRRLLVQHHKRPAGPLFDVKCVQQSVCRLHLPHCEIRSTGGGDFLSVAHVTDEDVEFISPHEITETHVIINITGFSAFGNVKDEDSPADPVRALVLLFYKPPADPVLTSLLNVLLLPRNVVLRDVLRIRKKLVGDECYIETSPHCKLYPGQEYSLSTRPEDDSVLVQPTEAEFDCDNYDNYFPSFQVRLKTMLTDIKLFLRDTNSSHVVWEREVCLSSTGGRRSALNLPPPERLMDIRSSFVDSISGPVLKSLLDKLLEKKVIGDSERESADVIQNNRDKARFVIDTVRKKGEAASSEMIEFLCEADPFLCEHLGLT